MALHVGFPVCTGIDPFWLRLVLTWDWFPRVYGDRPSPRFATWVA